MSLLQFNPPRRMLEAGVSGNIPSGLEGVVGMVERDDDDDSVLSFSLERLLGGRRSWTCCTASSCRKSAQHRERRDNKSDLNTEDICDIDTTVQIWKK